MRWRRRATSLLAVVVVVVAAGLILAPWWLRLVRGLAAERAERIRSQERAEMAAHLHDSVLQTLALMQRRADDPREVAALARRQERELRAWLNNGAAPERPRVSPRRSRRRRPRWRTPTACRRRRGGRRRAARRAAEAVVAAAREALVNAGEVRRRAAVSVYAEAEERAHRGLRARPRPGLRPRRGAGRPAGLRESILGRMERHGGRARDPHGGRRAAPRSSW